MTSTRVKAARGAQRERILVHRKAIMDMLDDGMRLRTILERLDLADIPIPTFHRHVKRIRKDVETAQTRIAPDRNLLPDADTAKPPETDTRALVERDARVRPNQEPVVEVKAEVKANHKLGGGFRSHVVEHDKGTMNLNPAEWRKKYGDHTS